MATQKVNINFSEGLQTKTDPWQVPMGQFEELKNSVFQTGSQLSKRPGYGEITMSTPPSSFITTLNDNLTSIGSSINAYSSSLGAWVSKGTLQPCALDVLPLIRNNLNQTQADCAIANNLVLTVFTQTNSTNSALVTQYMYAIADQTTGQNIVAPQAIVPLSTGSIVGSSRAYVVGNYFVVVSPVNVSATITLQYFSIPISAPLLNGSVNVSAPQNVTSDAYVAVGSNPSWDAVSLNNASNNVLVLAYNTSTGGQGVHVATLTVQQIASNQTSAIKSSFTNAAYIGAIISVCVDLTVSLNIFYISFWNNSTTNGYTCAVYIGLGIITQQFAPQQIITTTSVANLASAAQNGSCLVFDEVVNAYSYDSAIPTNFINGVTVSSAGVVGTPYVVVRSVGLASKAFVVSSKIYFLSAFQSPFQPSYFLINGSSSTSANPIVVSKLAYQNGGGYLALGLPNVSVVNGLACVPYLFKDDIEALNTLSNPQQTTAGGIYSQAGINLVSFDVLTKIVSAIEKAQNLQITGGYLSNYDGYLPVENNFFLFPDSVECTYNATSTVTPTGNVVSGNPIINTVSSVSGVSPGMTISGTGIPAGSVILYVGTTTITISKNPTATNTGVTLTIQGNIAAVPTGGVAGAGAYEYIALYEWSDNNGLISRSTTSIPVPITTTGSGTVGSVTISGPMLRLTYKVANKVKITLYRWSLFTQVYNQITTVSSPVLNDTTVDSWSFVDTQPDASIVGNSILYTTGGVVPNTNGPASNGIQTVFDNRMWALNSESPNTVFPSKQIIPNTPVEFSSFFSIYISPTTGNVKSLGPIRAMAPMDDKIVFFFDQGICYINGVGPDNLGTTSIGCSLGNYSQPIFITSVVGCSNQNSIVLTSDGLMFQSDKGIWLLGRGLQTTYIGAPVERYNDFTVTSANSIPNTNYVLFTLNDTTMLMYDYYYAQWGTFSGVYAISSCIQNNLHTVLDNFGRIGQQTPGQYVDFGNPISLYFKTSWIKIAELQGYQRFIDFYILARYLSPHFLDCQVGYDYISSSLTQTIISPKNFVPSNPSAFGSPTPLGAHTDKEQWRIYSQKQTCQSFQLSINEVFNPAFDTVPGAGFTMSGITARILVKKGTRPFGPTTSTGNS